MSAWDTVIVGGGIAGASLVGRWPGRLDKVLLIEREEQPGYHATGRSAAVFAETYGPPAVCALTRASRAFLTLPPPELGCAPLLTPRGVLMIAEQGQADLLDAEEAQLGTHRPPGWQRLSAAEAVGHLPVLREEKLDGALFDPAVADIDVHALHHGLLRSAKARGLSVRCRAELQAAQRTATGWQLRVSGETLHAQVLVNAAGAWADPVARLAGLVPLGVEPRRRSAFMLDAPPIAGYRHWPMAVALDNSWYLKPEAGGLLASPANADPTEPQDVQPEELDIALAMDRLAHMTSLTLRRPRHAWAGLRSFVADGVPVAGFDPREPAFFWLVGQGGYGLQTAPALGLAAASLLCGQPWPDELAAQGLRAADLAPDRCLSD